LASRSRRKVVASISATYLKFRRFMPVKVRTRVRRLCGLDTQAQVEGGGDRRAITRPTIAIETPTAKIRVPIANTCGGMPTLTDPYTQSGNVSVWPATKMVMMKSSIEREGARSDAERIAGKITGRVTRQKALQGFDPRSRAASESAGSRSCSR